MSASPATPGKSQRNERTSNEQQYEDCMPCRVMGSATFIGLGVYSLTFVNHPPPPPKPGRFEAESSTAAKHAKNAGRLWHPARLRRRLAIPLLRDQ
ncbi:hypothetical protein MRB53_041848 [Persea americana]|nr:hypothetical protein MRB53_041848 [Persea americana]